MTFDLKTALAVRERSDGLLEKDTFDLATAVSVENPREMTISAPKEKLPYSPPLTDEQKAQAVVELGYRERGEKVPVGLRADWALTSPRAKMISANILGGILTGGVIPAYNALKGIANASSPNSDIGKMIFESAYKGLAENEKIENLGGAAARAYPDAPWQLTGAMGALAEVMMFMPGIVKGGAELLSKDKQFTVALNTARQSPKWGDLITKVAEKSKQPVEVVDEALYRKLWEIRGEADYFKVLNFNLKKATGVDILSEVGSIPISKAKIGQSVNFTDPKGIVLSGVIKEITGQRAIINLAGKEVVATLSQLSLPEVATGGKPPVEPPPTAVLEPLAVEARKYETAEEFVQTQEDITNKKWLNIINDTVDNLNYESLEIYALRGDNFIPSKKFKKSFNRPDGAKTTKLDGVSAIGLAQNAAGGDNSINLDFLKQQIKKAKQYGKNIFLIKGDQIDVGNDDFNNEVILGNHKIIDKINSSKLTDIWNKAQSKLSQPTGGKPPVEPPPVAVSGKPTPEEPKSGKVLGEQGYQKLVAKRAKLKSFIRGQQFKNVDNLRLAMKLPKVDLMDDAQIDNFEKTLAPYKKQDVFLSKRQIETVDNTDLEGIRTIREARERLAGEINVPVEELDKIKVGELDRFRYDVALSEQNPFYKLLVAETHKNFIASDLKFMEFENKLNALTRLARASKQRDLTGKLVPTDPLVFKYLSSTDKEAIAKEMTPEELNLAVFLQEKFSEALEYLIKTGALETGRENYITNIRRGALEALKTDGLGSAFREMLDAYKQDLQVFNILDQATDTILPLEKFFQFSLRRTGEMKPTENVAKAASVYFKTLFKKQALDSIIPKMMIYTQSLTPTKMTPRGLEFDQSLKKFVKEWLNTKKGRKTKLLIKQGGVMDVVTTGLKSFVCILDLGLNIPVGIAANVGEAVAGFVGMGSKQTAIGLTRITTKQGKAILEKYEGFVGRTVWRELIEPSKNIGDSFSSLLFGLFSSSSVRANKISLLGMMTPEEFNAGEISLARLAEIRLNVGRWRVQPGMKSIIESTTEGGILSQYKSWAIPILRTTSTDIVNFGKKLGSGKALGSKESVELLRILEVTLAALLLGAVMGDKDEDESFTGQLLKKVRRESLTIMGALDPEMFFAEPRMAQWLAQLGKSLHQLMTLEKYKSRGREKELKGVTSIKKMLTPRAVKTVSPAPKTKKKIRD